MANLTIRANERKAIPLTKQKRIGLVIAVVVIIAAVAAACILLFGGTGQADSASGGGVVLDTNAVDFQSEETVNTDPQTIRFPGYSDIAIQQDDTVIPIVLTNPEGNPCLFQFEVTMDDAPDVLLSSDWVAPGKALEGIRLPATLDRGDHTLLLRISTCSLDGQETMNGGSVTVAIHVT